MLMDEQQFFDIAQAQLKAKVPAYRLADDRRREPMAVIVLTLCTGQRDKAGGAVLRKRCSAQRSSGQDSLGDGPS
ncbi:hypothetical protein [Cupriavidus sp. BIC8F]|uniref:hypothetical protein n=1 Tax=Cupriavidus sp. BIC8F TaxID=3079014 RepID=UPI0029162E63|nr:hypothetical protein [Cupriavidus sp. BIC8F]